MDSQWKIIFVRLDKVLHDHSMGENSPIPRIGEEVSLPMMAGTYKVLRVIHDYGHNKVFVII